MVKLLLDNNSSSDDEQNLHVNEKYANLYQRTEVLKDLRRAKDLGKDEDGDDESSESETEDEDAELLSPTLDVKIIETINSLRKKDPKIYDNSTVWFEKPTSEDDEQPISANVISNTQKKKFKDVLREQLLTQGADIDDEDIGLKRASGRFNYDQEQEQIRSAFLASASEFENASQALDIFGPDKSINQTDNTNDKKLVNALSEMKKLATNDEPDKEDFLTKYMEQKMWKPKIFSKRLDKDKVKADDGESESDYEEEEKELDEVDKFESKYNFRFEELQENNMVQGAQVMGHSRIVDGSVRRVDEKRKLQREQRIQRKEKEKRQKEAELRRLKNLKREEVLWDLNLYVCII